MNKAIIIGNLTREPAMRATNNGTSVCSFTVAVQRRFSNQATRSYDAQDGTKRYITEIVAEEVQFLDRVGTNSFQEPQPFNGEAKSFTVTGFTEMDDDNGLPF